MKKSLRSLISVLTMLLVVAAGCSGKRIQAPEVKPEEKPIQISEFILGVGDSFEVSVYRHDDLKKSVRIDSSGRFMYPLIGDVNASGKGIFQLRDELQQRLAKYVVEPQVTITLTAVQSQKIIVVGEVHTPGILSLDTDLTIMEALTKSGGMTSDAELANILLIRRVDGATRAESVDLKKAFREGDISHNVMMRAGDIVYVPATRIADVSRFFGYLGNILSPIVNLETGIVLWPQVKDVLRGKDSRTTFAITN